MLETLARLDLDRAGFVCFVTWTYPDRSGPPTPGETERDRQKMFKRFARMHPNASGIWRREWLPRESGEFVGVWYPHYHVLFFGLPYVHYAELNRIWCEVLGYDGYVRTEIKGIESWRQALYYVSKYMAKPEVGPSDGPGDARRQASTPAEADRSLVYVAYLTASEGDSEPEYELVPRQSIGRSWGKFNAKHLPWAERRSCSIRAGKWLYVAKHRARKVWPGIASSQSTGFTLFTDDAYKLYEELVSLRLPGPR